EPEERRLPGAVRAEQAVDLTPPDRKADGVHGAHGHAATGHDARGTERRADRAFGQGSGLAFGSYSFAHLDGHLSSPTSNKTKDRGSLPTVRAASPENLVLGHPVSGQAAPTTGERAGDGAIRNEAQHCATSFRDVDARSVAMGRYQAHARRGNDKATHDERAGVVRLVG